MAYDDGPGEVLRLIWRGKFAILIGAILGFLAANFLMSRAEPEYVTRMIIMPPAESGPIATGLRGPGLAAAASLAGYNLGDDSDPNFLALRQLIRSPRVLDAVEDRHAIKQRFFPDRWDEERRQWVEAPGFAASLKRTARDVIGRPEPLEPTMTDLQRVLDENYAMNEIERTGIYAVEMTWPEPTLPTELLGWTVEVADDIIRSDARSRAQSQIANLERRMASVALLEHRAALADLLGAQERQLMLMSSSESYSVRVLQEPVAQLQSPSIIRNWIVGIFGGGVVAFGLWLLYRALRGPA